MKQKLFYLIVLFALTLAFTGCGGSKTISPENQAASPVAQVEENIQTDDIDAASTGETDIAAVDQNKSEDVQQDDQQGTADNLVSEDFLMQIEDVFSITGRGTVATGKILSGQVSVDAEVELVGLADQPRIVTVGGIEMFRKLLDTAIAGDNVGIVLNDIERNDVQRGQVLAAKGSISAHNTFSADIVFTEKQADAFFSRGSFDGLSYFFTTDSNTVFYFDQALPDENGKLSVTAQMLARLPMKEGTTFRVLRGGTDIASGVVTSVDVEITAEPGIENGSIPDSTEQSAAEASDTAASNAGITDADNADAGPANFGVKLLSCGDQKIQVIKIIREITGLGLKEAKELADYTPSVIKENITQNEAEDIKSKLEGAGAAVDIIK